MWLAVSLIDSYLRNKTVKEEGVIPVHRLVSNFHLSYHDIYFVNYLILHNCYYVAQLSHFNAQYAQNGNIIFIFINDENMKDY